MAKSELQKTSKGDLKKYKQIFTDYYNAISKEDNTEEIKNKSLEFLKNYNKAVKAAKGVGKVKTKINWSKIVNTKLSGEQLNQYLNEITDGSHYTIAAALMSIFLADRRMSALDDFLKKKEKVYCLCKESGEEEMNKLKKRIIDFNKAMVDICFDKDAIAVWGYFGLSAEDAENLMTKLKKLGEVCESSNSLTKSVVSDIEKITDNADNFSRSYHDLCKKKMNEVENNYNKSKAVIEEKEKRSQSTTLTTIQTAKQNTTSKNVMAVVSLARKHHPIVLGPIAIKINNCLKKKKF